MKFETVHSKVGFNYYKIVYGKSIFYFCTEKSAKRKAAELAKMDRGYSIYITKGNDGGYKNSAFYGHPFKRVKFER
jgi:hypothetical protein